MRPPAPQRRQLILRDAAQNARPFGMRAYSEFLFRRGRPGWPPGRMRRFAFRELLQQSDVAANERFLLRSAPLLKLTLAFNCICNAIEPLREDQRHRRTRLGIALERPGIMLSNSALKRGSGDPDVVAAIGTPKNIKEGPFGHFEPLILRDARKSALLRMRRSRRLSIRQMNCGLPLTN
jgi:hypothetical protein